MYWYIAREAMLDGCSSFNRKAMERCNIGSLAQHTVSYSFKNVCSSSMYLLQRAASGPLWQTEALLNSVCSYTCRQ